MRTILLQKMGQIHSPNAFVQPGGRQGAGKLAQSCRLGHALARVGLMPSALQLLAGIPNKYGAAARCTSSYTGKQQAVVCSHEKNICVTGGTFTSFCHNSFEGLK